MMPKIVLTRGLPASGKSTWAKAWVEVDPSTRVRVSRDDIRYQLFGKYWGVDEQVVTKVEEAMVKAALDAGKSVVIDATHLASRYVRRWYNYGVAVELWDFVVPVGECEARDIGRAKFVGSDVIRSMAKRYNIPKDGTLPAAPVAEVTSQWVTAPEYDVRKKDAVIVDIDGTLANHTGVRDPYDTSRYHLDAPHKHVAWIVDALGRDATGGFEVIFVSGRDEAYRIVTSNWIEDNTPLLVDKLYMRPEGDSRNDAIVKHELYHKHIADKYNVIGVFDDRGRVLRMWRAIGLTTFAVGDTDNYNF